MFLLQIPKTGKGKKKALLVNKIDSSVKCFVEGFYNHCSQESQVTTVGFPSLSTWREYICKINLSCHPGDRGAIVRSFCNNLMERLGEISFPLRMTWLHYMNKSWNCAMVNYLFPWSRLSASFFLLKHLVTNRRIAILDTIANVHRWAPFVLNPSLQSFLFYV